jgi:replication factor A2
MINMYANMANKKLKACYANTKNIGNTMDYSNDGGGVAFQSPGGGDNAYQSQSSPAGKARPATEEQTLIPVTIRMILNSTDGMLEDGREPYNVKLVAAIRSVTPSSTAFNYEVEDGTGLFEVKEWLDEGGPLAKQQMREEAAREHQYVRIIGKMQVYDGKPSIVAYSVKKLSSSNEITHHFLEVVHSVEKYKKSGQIVGSPSLNVNGGMAMNGMNMGGFNNGSMPTTSTPLALDTNMGVDALKDDILQFLIGSKSILSQMRCF